MFEQMFTQSELEFLAEALDYRLKLGEFSGKNSQGDKFGTLEHRQSLNNLADKVVSFQEAEQEDDESDCASNI